MRCIAVRMGCVLFAESLGFSPRWVSLSLSLLTFCTVYLCTKWGSRGGECPWVTLLQLPNNTKRQFSGAFHSSIQTILLYLSLSTLYISSRLSDYPCTTKPKCHRTVDYKDLNSDLKACQAGGASQQQVSTIVYVSLARAYVTLIKSTYLLTY